MSHKVTRLDAVMFYVERDIRDREPVETKRDLSLAYSTAAERVGQNNFPRVRDAAPDGFRKSSKEQSIRRILNP